MDESAMMVEMSINNGDGDYMEQEEEWEREGLLDPAWEKQQRKVRIPFYLVKKSTRKFSWISTSRSRPLAAWPRSNRLIFR